MKLFGKKGQEEIMGFLLVVILIIVIGMAMLFLFKPKELDQTDTQLENLLFSIMSTTYDGKDIAARIRNCEFGEDCEELGIALDKIFNVTLTKSGTAIGQNIKGYELEMSERIEYYVLNGEITTTSRGSAIVVGETLVRLRFYY